MADTAVNDLIDFTGTIGDTDHVIVTEAGIARKANVSKILNDQKVIQADQADLLEAGFTSIDVDAGLKDSGTWTPDPSLSNFQHAINGGEHALSPPANSCTMLIQYTNTSSAGLVLNSAFDAVDGDPYTIGDGERFILAVTVINGISWLNVKAMQ